MEDTPRKTAGQLAHDNLTKNRHNTEIASVVDVGEDMMKDYVPNLIEAAQRGESYWPNTDFFVVVLKRDVQAVGVGVRLQFFPTSACPTPNFDQDAYRFISASGDLKHLWSIPCLDACTYLYSNKASIAQEEYQLLSFVIAFKEGMLDQVCRYLNKESDEKPNFKF